MYARSWYAIGSIALVLGVNGCQKPAVQSTSQSPSKQQTKVAEPEKTVESAQNPEATSPDIATSSDEPREVNKAESLDLSKFVQMRAADFPKSTGFPWPAVPQGPQEFNGLPINVSGAIMLWGKRNADRGMVYPESVGPVKINCKFNKINLVHAGFYPSMPADEVYSVVFKYADGEQAKEGVVWDGDIQDWFVKGELSDFLPTNERSKIAWSGTGKAFGKDQLIAFTITSITNPHPNKVVQAIEFQSSRGDTAGCIIGVCIGP